MSDGRTQHFRPVAARRAAAAAALVLAAVAPIHAARADAPTEEPAGVLTRVGAVRFVVPGTTGGETGPDGSVFTGARVRSWLEGEKGRTCEPARLAELIASHYRALGYIPTVRAFCDGGEASADVRESSHRVAIITFDVADLAPLNVKPQRLVDEKKFYPVPESAPRAVLRGLLQTRPGDLYNVERHRLDRVALGRLGYVLLFIPGAAPEQDVVGDGAD